MSEHANLLDLHSAGGQQVAIGGYRPLKVNTKTGQVVLNESDGLRVNSILRRDEWDQMEAAVLQVSEEELVAVQDLRSMGLVKTLGSEGTLMSSWSTGSDMTDAEVSMEGRSRSQNDLQELKTSGVPVPVIFKDFDIGRRMLAASRQMGDGLDTTNAMKAARVVVRKEEDILFGGSNIVMNGNTLYGYTNHPNRLTDTATNYGGGSWGTAITNILPTIAGAINAMNGINRYRRFGLYISQTQYNLAAMSYYTDGSGQTPLDRIKGLDAIEFVRSVPASRLAGGTAVLVHMVSDNVRMVETVPVSPLEWTSGDGMTHSFKVMTIASFELKPEYDGTLGVCHITGAA